MTMLLLACLGTLCGLLADLLCPGEQDWQMDQFVSVGGALLASATLGALMGVWFAGFLGAAAAIVTKKRMYLARVKRAG